jgi:hypothetical protein
MAYYVNFALKVLNFIAFLKKKHYFFEKNEKLAQNLLVK